MNLQDNKDGLPNTTRRSELPNMREKTPVMNVHIPPSIEVPAITEYCSTSFINSLDPGSEDISPGMEILRDEKPPPETGGLGSGNTLSILKMSAS